MRSRLNRQLQFSCVGLIGLGTGLLIESRFMKTPQVIQRPVQSAGLAEEALAKVVPDIDLEATPFNEAVEKVRAQSAVPIVVHWEKLTDVHVDTRAPVTFRARDATLGRILSELVYALRTTTYSAAFAPAGDVILISTADDAAPRGAVVRSYDVRDLLRPLDDPWELGDPPEPFLGGYPAFASKSTQSREENLKLLVQDTVAAKSWGSAGGTGSICFFAGRMIVTQTWEDHRRIAELLAELREPATPPAPQPTIDVKLWNDTLKKYVSTNDSVSEAALRRRIPEVRLDNVPLKQAVTTLADLARADLIVDWGAFELTGVRDETPVSLRLRDVTLAEALPALLRAGGATKVDFHIIGGFVILTLASKDNPYGPATTRAYDIRDWLAALIGPPPTPAHGAPTDVSSWVALHNAQVNRLVQVIKSSLPDSWNESIASIEVLRGRLIVTQTWENQERVADLLAALRVDPYRIRSSPDDGFKPSP